MFNESLASVTYSVIIWIAGFLSLTSVFRKHSITPQRLGLIYALHTVLALTYYHYSLLNPSDSSFYFEQAFSADHIPLGLSTRFIVSLQYILIHVLGLSYLGSFMLYNIIGAAGVIILQVLVNPSISRTLTLKSILFTLFIFSPTVNYWSCAIGKDSIFFLGSMILVFGFSSFPLQRSSILIGILILFTIRPYTILFLALGSIVDVLSSARLRLANLVALFALLATLTFLLDFFAIFINSSTISFESIGSFLATRAESGSGGSGIDLVSIPLALRPLSFLFRPFFFDSTSILSVIASFDNLIIAILLFSFLALLRKPLNIKPWPGFLALLIYSSSSLISLSLITPNLGLALRTKTPYIAILVILYSQLDSYARLKSKSST